MEDSKLKDLLIDFWNYARYRDSVNQEEIEEFLNYYISEHVL